MTDGFKAYTNTGLFQIDGVTPNFQLVNRQFGTTQQTVLNTVYNNVGTQFTATYWAITFTFAADSPLVAFRADDGYRVCPWKFSRSGNVYSATFITDVQAPVTMWVFDKAQATADNFGFKVYDPSGNLVCSAIQPMSKIADVIAGQYFAGTGFYSGGGQMPGDNPQTRGYSFKPAFAACYPAHYMESSGGGSGASTNMSGLLVSGNTIQWDFHTYNGVRSGNYVGFREATAYRFLVLDMTGIP